MAALTVPKTSLDLQILLQERLEMLPKEFEKKFDIEETDDKLILKVHRDSSGKFVWLETHVWTVTNNYIREVGGSYFKPERKWEIPLKDGTDSQATNKEVANEIQTPPQVEPYEGMRQRIEKKLEGPIPIKPTVHERMDTTINNILNAGRELEANGYDLKKSKEALGTLIPILTDAHGNIIDGFHREKIDPDWPKVEAKHITDPVQLSMARLAANVCRRNVPPEEKSKLLANIAELTGWDAKAIAEALGMTERWVLKYLPTEFKDSTKVEIGRLGGEAVAQKYQNLSERRSPKSDDIRQESPSFESESITPTVPVEKIDTGVIFTCPTCGWTGTHIHISSKHHKLQEVKEF